MSGVACQGQFDGDKSTEIAQFCVRTTIALFRILKKQAPAAETDEALLIRYQTGGDMEALGRLYERYMELVYGVCLKYLQSEADAEDAVMQIFEELTDKCCKAQINAFRPWLYTVAKNHCLMALRKASRQALDTSDPALVQSDALWHPDMEDADETTLRLLRQCLERLPPQQKQCIDLFYMQGYSYKGIAGMQGEDIGTVRSHIQNGRRNLRKCMNRQNHDNE